ncbi:MAG: uncharacterized protein JWN38_533 [Candidatus Saccharibacteria bacterium]|nr:uncharacterized protein [Candidatus Saccharibacteria bacterium]
MIRHAQTPLNLTPDVVNGRSNHMGLTEEGVEQAHRLGRGLLKANLFPTKVFSSPAKRCLLTATISLQEMGLDTQPLVQHAIQELSHGPWEGQPRDEAYPPAVLADMKAQGKDFKLPGGESMNDVGQRMHGWVTETFADTPPADSPARYFVYTHNGSIKYLASLLYGWSHQQSYDFNVDNTALSLLTIENGEMDFAYLNRDVEDL